MKIHVWFGVGAAFLVSSSAHAALKNYTATLTGGQMVPPVATTATGTATLQVDDNPSSRMITGTITFTGITPTKGELIGGGACGNNAPTGGEDLSAAVGNTITVNVSPGIVQYGQILGGGGYIKLSSAANPKGEIRGQMYEVGSGMTCEGADAGAPPDSGATDSGASPDASNGGMSSSGAPGAPGSSSGADPSGADGGSTSAASGDDGGCNSTSRGTGSGAAALLVIGLGLVRARRRRR